MGKKIWNKTNILTLAGILAYVVTILVLFIPFKEDPSMSLVNWHSPLGIVVIFVFMFSVILYFLAFFKREQIRLTKSQLDSLIENRQKYLLPLQTLVKDRLKIADSISLTAGKNPLEDYQKRYLPFHRNKTPLQIQNALANRGFMYNNRYYQLLKDSNKEFQSTIQSYDVNYVQIKDKKLKKYLNQLWQREHWTNSMKSYTILAKNEKRIKHTPFGLSVAKIGERVNEENRNAAMKIVFERIDELLDGDDDV
jgi:hypothetical protein